MPRIEKWADKANYILRNNKKMIIAIIIVFFLILDRFFKSLALIMPGRKPISVIKDFFVIKFFPNYNIAFSIPVSGVFLDIGIILIILFLIYCLTFSYKRGSSYFFLLLIIFGAASNLFDRLKYGFVIDYFNLRYFTVFNLADALLFAGAALAIASAKK
jgi:signal peptidase II